MKHNKIEQIKSICIPYDFREKLFSLDMENLSEADRFYLKNYGIYNIKVLPEKFMLRIRVAGGRIAREKLAAISTVAKVYGLELLLTSRAQLELHGLTALNVLEVWQRLQKEKITTLQTLTDNFRNIVTDPYDGADRENYVEVYPLIEQMQALFLNKAEWMGMLPRKFNVAICGTAVTSVHFFGNDLYFALAKQKEVWGFNLYLGGKNSEVAQPSGLFVLPNEVPAMFEAVAKAYRTYGLRGSRAKTRLFYLLQEIGMESFVKKVKHFYPHPVREKGSVKIGKNSPSAVRELKNDTFGLCYQTHFGKVDMMSLQAILDYTQKNNLEIRLGTDQNFYFLGAKERTLPFKSVQGASHITACAGSDYCALSLWNIKEEAACLPLEKIVLYNIQLGFSGCLKGCGRHHHSDIGLVGLRTNLFGETQKSARIFLGGEYTQGKATARLLFYAVPLLHLNSLLEAIIEEFVASGEKEFESFSHHYLNVHSENFITLWFLAKLYLDEAIQLEQISEEMLYAKLLKHQDFPAFEHNENYQESIKVMMHSLWDDAV